MYARLHTVRNIRHPLPYLLRSGFKIASGVRILLLPSFPMYTHRLLPEYRMNGIAISFARIGESLGTNLIGRRITDRCRYLSWNCIRITCMFQCCVQGRLRELFGRGILCTTTRRFLDIVFFFSLSLSLSLSLFLQSTIRSYYIYFSNCLLWMIKYNNIYNFMTKFRSVQKFLPMWINVCTHAIL